MCRYIAKSRKTKYQVNYRRVRVGIPIRSLLHVLLRALYRQNPMIEITFFYGALYTEYVIDHSTSEGPSIACGQTTMHMLSIDMCMLCTQYQRGTGRRCRSISSSLASSLPTRRTDTVSITDALTHVKRLKHAISRMRACNPCHVHHRTHQRYLPLHQPRTVSPSASQPFHGQQNTVDTVHKSISYRSRNRDQASPRDLYPAACMMYDSCQRTGVSHGSPSAL